MTALFDPAAAPGAADAPASAVPGGAPAVVGLDLSLAATGIAGPDGTQVVQSTGHKGDTLTQRAARLLTLRTHIATTVEASGAELVTVEAPSFGQQRQGGTHDRSGLWWLVVTQILAAGIEVIEVPPASIKKYATGSGVAKKPDIRMAIFKRYGLDIADDNEADAFVLRAIGLDLLGHPLVELPAAHRQALAKLPRPALRGAA